jgi:hypothetical protein
VRVELLDRPTLDVVRTQRRDAFYLVLLGAVLFGFTWFLLLLFVLVIPSGGTVGDIVAWSLITGCGVLLIVAVVTFLVGWFRLAGSYLRRSPTRTSN